jgi:hypothetical protein
MSTKLVFAALIAGLTIGLALSPSEAAVYKHSGCASAAKYRYPHDHAARKAFKHQCKAQWKIYKKAHP